MSNLDLSSASLLLKAIALFRSEILQESCFCLHVVTVTDLSLSILHNDPSWYQGDPQVIFPLPDTINNSTFSWSFFSHYGACGLILHDVSKLLSIWFEVSINGIPEWPSTQIFGTLQRDFNFFIISQESNQTALNELAWSTRKLRNSFFLFLSTERLSIYKLRANGLDLVYISTFPVKHHAKLLALNDKSLRYDGSPMMGILLCGGCLLKLEKFEKTGKWEYTVLAIFYEVCKQANATLEFQEVLSTFGDGKNEDGEWDEFTQPLVSGLAEISIMLRSSLEKFRAIYVTRPFAMGNVGFITKRPLKVNNNKLSKLLTPFEMDTWLASVVSIAFLWLAIEMTIRLGHPGVDVIQDHYLLTCELSKGMKKEPKHMTFLTLSTLLQNAVNQPGSSCEFERIIRRGIAARLLMGLWLIALIILICGYTTTMTSHIVLPMYTAVPTTFQELAESNYKLFVEFWTDNIEYDFAAINKSFSKEIAARVEDTDILNDECIQVIKESDQACITYVVRFHEDRTGHLIDAHGEKRYVRSKETRFHTSATFGVSRYFPAVFETLDRLVSLCLSHGLIKSWEKNVVSANQMEARLRARKLHSSDKAVDLSNEQSISRFVANIFLLGDAVGAVVFLVEFYLGFRSRLKTTVVEYRFDTPDFHGDTRARVLNLCRIGIFHLYFLVVPFKVASRRFYLK